MQGKSASLNRTYGSRFGSEDPINGEAGYLKREFIVDELIVVIISSLSLSDFGSIRLMLQTPEREPRIAPSFWQRLGQWS